jgi:hypothetical protein
MLANLQNIVKSISLSCTSRILKAKINNKFVARKTQKQGVCFCENRQNQLFQLKYLSDMNDQDIANLVR